MRKHAKMLNIRSTKLARCSSKCNNKHIIITITTITINKQKMAVAVTQFAFSNYLSQLVTSVHRTAGHLLFGMFVHAFCLLFLFLFFFFCCSGSAFNLFVHVGCCFLIHRLCVRTGNFLAVSLLRLRFVKFYGLVSR